jgi:hypothetical protein
MGRPYDPARAMRERLKVLEAREQARTEAKAVAEGVAESVDLARGRGAAFEKPAARLGAKGGERETPYRRQTGLEWLAKKGRITAAQRQAGEAYGAAFRRAGAGARIGSTLEVQPGGGGSAGGPSLALVLARAEGRLRAEDALAAMRGRLFGQGDLVSVCDQVCGRELTPREAGGGEREGLRVEAVLKVALDLLLLRR